MIIPVPGNPFFTKRTSSSELVIQEQMQGCKTRPQQAKTTKGVDE
jgi:hypothetical protein